MRKEHIFTMADRCCMNTVKACAMADAGSFMRFSMTDLMSIAAAMLIFVIKGVKFLLIPANLLVRLSVPVKSLPISV